MKKGFDYFIYYVLFFVPLVCILYGFNILAMHYIIGFIPVVITITAIIILLIKKINSNIKDYILIVLLTLSIISVPVSHIMSITNPFTFKCKGINGGGIELTGYKISFINDYEKKLVLEIPSKVMGRKVKSIGEEAFAECYKIRELVIPEGVEQIKTKAFMNTNYTKVVLPNTLKVVEDYAFFNNRSYEEIVDYIVLPESLVYVGESAFYNSARSIFISKTEEMVFDIEKWNLNWNRYYNDGFRYPINCYYDYVGFQVIDNVLYVLLKDQTALVSIIYESEKINILDKVVYENIEYTVTCIDMLAGSYSTFDEIKIPNTIKEIRSLAFANRITPISIYIPVSVLYMGAYVFTNGLYPYTITVNVEHAEIPITWDENWEQAVIVNLNIPAN